MEPTSAPPVFVDATGRRHRRMRKIGVVVAGCFVAYLAVVGVGLAGGPRVPFASWPIGSTSGAQHGSLATLGPQSVHGSTVGTSGSGNPQGGPTTGAPTPGSTVSPSPSSDPSPIPDPSPVAPTPTPRHTHTPPGQTKKPTHTPRGMAS